MTAMVNGQLSLAWEWVRFADVIWQLQVIAEGANAIVAGSAVFKAKDYAGGKRKVAL